MAHLIRIDWPHNGIPDVPPALSLAECRARLAALRRVAKGRGYAAVVVYGDREHAANIQWLTGFDPRFEEAVLVVTPKTAPLMAGNECLSYTAISPLVQAGDIKVEHCASLSLQSQPRGTRTVAATSGMRCREVSWVRSAGNGSGRTRPGPRHHAGPARLYRRSLCGQRAEGGKCDRPDDPPGPRHPRAGGRDRDCKAGIQQSHGCSRPAPHRLCPA